MLYLVSYDLMKPGKDYADLTAALTTLGAKRVLESEWLVVSSLDRTTLYNRIVTEGKMDPNDRILLTELKRNAIWDKVLLSDATMQQMFSNASG